MKKLRVGQIGTLHDHSQGKLACAAKFPDIFEIVGVVPDSDETIAEARARGYENFTYLTREQLQKTKPFCDYPLLTEEQLYNAGCDLILVEGFEYDLVPTALRCVENGIPVHVDKPAGRDLSEFERLIEAARRRSLPLQLAYMYRYNPAVIDCVERISRGELGDIINVTAVMNIEYDITKRRWLNQFDAGMMFFLGCHMVDLVHLVYGVPERITPFLKVCPDGGNTSRDSTSAVFEYPSGIAFVQSNGNEVSGFQRRQLVVSGTRGTYEIRPLEWQPRALISTVGNHTEPLEFPSIGSSRYDAMLLDFAAMVRGEVENRFDYDYELDTQKMVLAACGAM